MLEVRSPHRRYNPLLDEWVLCSPERLTRPWRGERHETPRAAVPAYDADCYMCPGNPRATGRRNPKYTTVFVFDNDFPAVTRGAPYEPESSPHPLLRAHGETGSCRVLCFSPRHNDHLGSMFDTAFPYSMGWYQEPMDGDDHPGFRLHAVYLPPLLRSAEVRKYLVGYELTAEPQRDFTPEEAADRLRAVKGTNP